MINLQNNNNSFEYENNFYLTCYYTRMAKWAAHYEFFKMTEDFDF